jgi:peptide-methionine (S)-S-oxide reductase
MTDSAKLETIVLGGGCFWCTEAVFQRVEGVSSVVSGYAGGHVANPSYEQVSAGNTGHAEVDQITFDPKVISLHDILEIFFTTHDPTTPGRQGNDVGPQYRSIVLYSDQKQKQAAEDIIKEIQDLWPHPIITEIKPLDKFYQAEEYHQNYFNKNPTQGYCQVVINPKLAKLRQKFSTRLKEGA